MNEAGGAIRSAIGHVIQAQQGRLVLWLPVAMGTGAAIYLTLPFETSLAGLALSSMFTTVALFLALRGNWSKYLTNIIWLLLSLSLGATVCKLRTEHVRAPVLPAGSMQTFVTGYIVDNVSPSADQPRLLIAPVQIRGVAAGDTPLRLRVSLRPGTLEVSDVAPGDAVSFFAILSPPGGPSLPGGYDFARASFYQGIGSTGLAPGLLTRVAPSPVNWRLKAMMQLNRWRWQLTQTIVAAIIPVYVDDRGLGGFAAALVTGQQAYVPARMVQDMRDSGLAHILSISGVHMAVVGGFVFFALRTGMALIPPLALNWPIKKWAAGFSMVFVLIYLAISGCPAPAVRAAVVACVAFLAILLDRRALSLRALAIAAIVVIALTPEAVIQPGFQMSFSATAALLALAEAQRHPAPEIDVPWWVKSIQQSLRGLWLSLVASLVATVATTPFAIAYFNRFSVYGLVSNLFEAPVTAFVVMPGLAIGSVLSATLPGRLALRFAAGGLWLIDHISSFTAHLPQAVFTWPSAPDYVLAVSFAGIVWLCLVRGKARWAGLLLASSILWWPRVHAPDVWLDSDGGNAAIRIGHDTFAMRTKVRRYGFEQWTRHYGLTETGDDARDRYYVCQGYGCMPKPEVPAKIAFWFSNKPPKASRFEALCKSSTLVVMRNPVGDWPETCAGVNHITAGDFRQLGAMELTRQQKGWAITAAQPLRGNRYWSTPSDADASGQ